MVLIRRAFLEGDIFFAWPKEMTNGELSIDQPYLTGTRTKMLLPYGVITILKSTKGNETDKTIVITI
jgi:hypothetical protein